MTLHDAIKLTTTHCIILCSNNSSLHLTPPTPACCSPLSWSRSASVSRSNWRAYRSSWRLSKRGPRRRSSVWRKSWPVGLTRCVDTKVLHLKQHLRVWRIPQGMLFMKMFSIILWLISFLGSSPQAPSTLFYTA